MLEMTEDMIQDLSPEGGLARFLAPGFSQWESGCSQEKIAPG